VRYAGRHLFAEAGEGRLILSVDGGSRSITAAAAATEVASTSTTSLATVATATATTTATTGATTTSALGLDKAGVEVNGLLDLALTLTLLLTVATSVVLLLVVLERLGVLPLLVELATLVGLANVKGVFEAELLLGLLSEVLGVGDGLVLRLGGLFGSVLSSGILLLALSDGITGLLVLQLGVALSSAPRGGGLLIGATMIQS
jgi:hypothetical protein